MDPYDPNDRGTGAINNGEPQHVILSGREYERYLCGALNEPDMFLTDTMQMLEVAAGIMSDNAQVLYGGSGQYDQFVSQMRERAKELGQLAGLRAATT